MEGLQGYRDPLGSSGRKDRKRHRQGRLIAHVGRCQSVEYCTGTLASEIPDNSGEEGPIDNWGILGTGLAADIRGPLIQDNHC